MVYVMHFYCRRVFCEVRQKREKILRKTKYPRKNGHNIMEPWWFDSYLLLNILCFWLLKSKLSYRKKNWIFEELPINQRRTIRLEANLKLYIDLWLWFAMGSLCAFSHSLWENVHDDPRTGGKILKGTSK